MILVFDPSVNSTQRQWFEQGLAACKTDPADIITGTVTVTTVSEPSCPGHQDTMCTHTAGEEHTIEIRDGLELAGNQWAGPHDFKRYFIETCIHEIGHVVIFQQIDSDADRAEFAAMFRSTVTGTGQRAGTLDDWNPLDKIWEDRVQEAAAETIKDILLPDSWRVFENRTNWDLPRTNFSAFMTKAGILGGGGTTVQNGPPLVAEGRTWTLPTFLTTDPAGNPFPDFPVSPNWAQYRGSSYADGSGWTDHYTWLEMTFPAEQNPDKELLLVWDNSDPSYEWAGGGAFDSWWASGVGIIPFIFASDWSSPTQYDLGPLFEGSDTHIFGTGEATWDGIATQFSWWPLAAPGQTGSPADDSGFGLYGFMDASTYPDKIVQRLKFYDIPEETDGTQDWYVYMEFDQFLPDGAVPNFPQVYVPVASEPPTWPYEDPGIAMGGGPRGVIRLGR